MPTNFPTSLDSFSSVSGSDDADAAYWNNLQDAILALEQKVGIGSYTYDLHSLVYNFFASGRTVWLYEVTPPTGWSLEAPSDCVIAVAGGSGVYNVTGGQVVGTAWSTLNAHVHSLSSHYHWIASGHIHKLYTVAINSVTYDTNGNQTIVYQGTAFANTNALSRYKPTVYYDMYCASAGAQATNANTGNTSATREQLSDNRLPACIGIIASKD